MILLVDDEQAVLEGQRNLLNLHGYEEVQCAKSLDEAMGCLQRESVDLALVDLNLGTGSGFELMKWIGEHAPETEVIVVTAASDVKSAVESMKLGATDFLVKGVDTDRFVTSVSRALSQREARREAQAIRNAFLRDRLENPDAFSAFVTRSDHVHRIFMYLEAVAPLPDPILITGETGVGKEVLARAIHAAAGGTGEFVPVNLGGLDDHTISDTLFGHVRGAYTGAHSNRDGLIRSATGGTLFVDEFAEISMESQVKLLRLLDSGEYYPLGSDRIHNARTRFIFATNRDLESGIELGTFRRDLYFRISNHHIRVPALRDRPEDVAPILETLLEHEAHRLSRTVPEVTDEVVGALQTMPLDGNVRELQRIALMALLGGGWQHVTGHAGRGPGGVTPGPDGEVVRGPGRLSEGSIAFGQTLPTPSEAIEELLREADRRHPSNRSAAAKSVGLSPQAFANRWRRMTDESSDADGT
ncbi:MAG: sigma-54-dependent transcriptional regulator [Spirochaetota bacterium]